VALPRRLFNLTHAICKNQLLGLECEGRFTICTNYHELKIQHWLSSIANSLGITYFTGLRQRYLLHRQVLHGESHRTTDDGTASIEAVREPVKNKK